jgi:hypothetical protein
MQAVLVELKKHIKKHNLPRLTLLTTATQLVIARSGMHQTLH